MKTINLSRRPFVNRRPIIRLGIALWVLGCLLVLANMTLFKGYWAGSHNVRAALETADEQAALELEELETLDGQIDRINVAAQNSQAIYLNSLISYRTFPWSALFDDLERVTPLDVRLQTVTPAVRLAASEAVERAQNLAQRERVERRRQRSRRSSSETTSSRRSSRRSSSRSAAPEADPNALASDEVRLQFRGIAKTEDALIDFLDTLYRDDSFRQPVLSGERFETVGGSLNSSFDITAIYLTKNRSLEASDASGDEDAAEGGETSVADDMVADDGITREPDPEDDEHMAGGASEGDLAAVQPASSGVPLATAGDVAPPSVRSEADSRNDGVAREEAFREPRSREDVASDEAESRPPESAADERRRRIEELRQRRRDAVRRSRGGVVGGRPSSGGFLGTAGDGGDIGDGGPTGEDQGSTQPETRTPRGERRGSTRDNNRNNDSNGTDSPASATPRVQGSLVPGLPELLDRLWPSKPSPITELLEELG